LAKEYLTGRGYLSEKIENIKYNNISNKLDYLNNTINEISENFKEYDKIDKIDLMLEYANNTELSNFKKNEKIKEITIKAQNRLDIPLILTLKDIWVLKTMQALILIFYIILLILNFGFFKIEKMIILFI